MKLTPRSPDPSVNSPTQSTVKDVGLILFGAAMGLILLGTLAVTVAEWVIERIEPSTEVELFAPLLDDLLEVLIEEGRDRDAEALIQPLFARIVDAAPEMPHTFTLRVSCSEVPNAFAVPGGAIVVTAGLLRHLETEEQLAFVLGHELGHFVNRDHLRGLGRALGLGSVMGLLFSGAGLDPTLALELVNEGIASAYSRRQELEADAIGLETIRRVDPATEHAAVEALELLDELEEPTDLEVVNFLRSHPLGAQRIQALGARLTHRAHDPRGRLATPLTEALTSACQGESASSGAPQ